MPRVLRLAVAMLLILPFAAAATPQIQRWQTDNGATVAFVPAHELPIVDVRLVLDAGSARDGDHPGIARLTNNLLLEGTAKRSAGEIARGFEQVGAQVSTGSARDMAWLHLRSLSRGQSFDPALDQLVEVLTAPAFAADAFNRVREQMRVSLRHAQRDPGALAHRAFMRAVFRDHPYATPPAGTLEGLAGIQRDEVRAFHQRYYAAANATIAIVGDLTRDRAETLAGRLASAFPRGQAAAALPEVAPLKQARTVRIPFDSEQTHVLIGEPAVARGDSRWAPLYLANHVLGGGGLVSLLTERMREQRGLSYSTASSVSAAAAGGWFQISTQVRNDKLGEALSVLRSTLEEFHEQGPSEKRLELARRNITGSFPLNFDSNRDLVGYVAMIGFYDLPLDYLENFRARIGELTRSRVSEVFRTVTNPNREVTVLLGPKAIIDAAAADDGRP